MELTAARERMHVFFVRVCRAYLADPQREEGGELFLRAFAPECWREAVGLGAETPIH